MRTLVRSLVFLALLPLAAQQVAAQRAPRIFTHADTLRGSNGPGRAWWDATFYDLHVTVNPADSSIRGWNAITYRVLTRSSPMQIDLQEPLEVDSVLQGGQPLVYRRDGNAVFVNVPAARAPASGTVTVFYHGKPKVAVRPPWGGGFIWQHDSLGRRWVAT